MDSTILPFLPILVAASVILISLTVHEFSHALVAHLQKDPTPSRAGRLTLNPLSHIDPVGTILVPALFLLPSLIPGSGIPPMLFGWAKPVPFNPFNLSNQRYGPLYVGLAGPVSNLILFLGCGSLLTYAFPTLPEQNFLSIFLAFMMQVNFLLALFNLLPIPPLDGSKIIPSLLPPHYVWAGERIEQWGPTILLVMLFVEFAVYPVISNTVSALYHLAVRALF